MPQRFKARTDGDRSGCRAAVPPGWIRVPGGWISSTAGDHVRKVSALKAVEQRPPRCR